jgi:hypothetical protein
MARDPELRSAGASGGAEASAAAENLSDTLTKAAPPPSEGINAESPSAVVAQNSPPTPPPPPRSAESWLRGFIARPVVLIAIAVLVGVAVLLGSFYVRPPAAVRTVATTGSLAFELPLDSKVNSRLAWPVGQISICGIPSADSFTLETTIENAHPCPSATNFDGTLWFEAGVTVKITSSPNALAEVSLGFAIPDQTGKVGVLRSVDGAEVELAAPVKLLILRQGSSTVELVLPVVGQTVQVGQETPWQSLASGPVLQTGEVTLVHASLFGDMLFTPDKVSLLLGDWLKLKSRNADYIQGVVQLRGGSFDAALTVSQGDAWLHRLARDPMHLDTPLAAQLFSDPTVIILSVLASFAIGVWLSIQEVRAANPKRNRS